MNTPLVPPVGLFEIVPPTPSKKEQRNELKMENRVLVVIMVYKKWNLFFP